MKGYPVKCIILFALFPVSLFGQEERAKYVGIDVGMDFISCQAPELDYVRAERFSYMEGGATDNLKGLLYKSYVGVKTEFRSKNNKFGLLTGLRLNRLDASLGKDSYWSGSPDFFYFVYQQNETTTEYLKVKEITQKTDYIGIPLEIRLFPFNQRRFRVFFKASAEFNYLMQNKTTVDFVNNEMKPYQDYIVKTIGKPQSFYSLLYFSGGIKFGNDTKPGVSFEVTMPSVFLTPDAIEMLKPEAGMGFQINFQLPF